MIVFVGFANVAVKGDGQTRVQRESRARKSKWECQGNAKSKNGCRCFFISVFSRNFVMVEK